MPQVSVLRHRGRLAALPVSQVRTVARELPPDATPLALWPGVQPETCQWACCTTSQGRTVYLACDWTRIVSLARDDVFALSPLLERALRDAPVVGMGHSPLGMLWLVDLRSESAAG